jgi:hypothetical protein
VFKVGDRVLRVNNVLSDASLGFSSGLAPAYEGPFVISKRIGKNVFDLVTLDDEPAGHRHADVLKLYREQPEWAMGGKNQNDAVVSSSVNEEMEESQSSGDDGVPKLRPNRKITKHARYLD